MTRFSPSRFYLTSAAVAMGLAAFSGWCAMAWLPALLPALLFLLSASLLLTLALQPSIEVHDTHLQIGARGIAWNEIRRVDQTGWAAPMVAYLTLADGGRVRLLYPGDMDTANQLLGMIQQHSTRALINGVPYRQIFGEPAAPPPPRMASPRVRLLTPEDEAEVERMYLELKRAGRVDPED
jgi:hypothetical protein